MFKKTLCILLTIFIILSCCSCVSPSSGSQAQGTTNNQNVSIQNNTNSSTEKQTQPATDSNNSDITNTTDTNKSTDIPNNSDTTDDIPSKENDYVIIGGTTPYTIIYESGYLSKANTLIGYLTEFDNTTQYTAKNDTDADDNDFEILIGLTSRKASTQAKSLLSAYLDFSILVADNKIAIYANTPERIDAAIYYFVSTLVYTKDGSLAYPTTKAYVEAYESYKYPNLTIANKPINNFSIVVSHNATQAEKDAAINLSMWIAENNGYFPKTVYDSTTPTINEIIIGNAERTECAEYTDKLIYSVLIKGNKLLIYANDSESYDLALKAFIENVELSSGELNALDIKILQEQDNSNENENNNENNNDNVSENENQEPTPTTKKKAIFIGNSFIYWGGCVTFISNDESNEAIRVAGGDKGYFNEICKANNIDVDVYNYTYGGQNLDWIYKNKLKKLSSSFLDDIDYVFISEAGQNQSSFKTTVNNVAGLFKNAKEIVYLAHEYTFSTNATYIINSLDDLAAQGYKIVAWGALVNDVYNGKVSVPNATLKYNKNTFIKNASTSEKMNSNAAVISLSGYGDSFHQNPLSGYITAQMCFSAITGISAVGQKYDFCWDKTIAPQYDLQNFLTYQYGKGQTSNFIDVFNSSADMLGLQKLMDEYMVKYN